MIVLDASALIAQLDANDAHHARIRELLLERADEPLGASVITLAEALVAPARAGRLEQARALLDELQIEPVGLGADAVSRLAALRAETGLRMPDCCVLLAAALAGADTLVTFDQRLARAAGERRLKAAGEVEPAFGAEAETNANDDQAPEGEAGGPPSADQVV